MLLSPGGAGGGAAAEVPGQAEELGGQAGWAACAAAIHGGVAASGCGGQVAAEGQPESASAAALSEPAAQFQSAPLVPTCCQPWSSTSEIFPLPLPKPLPLPPYPLPLFLPHPFPPGKLGLPPSPLPLPFGTNLPPPLLTQLAASWPFPRQFPHTGPVPALPAPLAEWQRKLG